MLENLKTLDMSEVRKLSGTKDAINGFSPISDALELKDRLAKKAYGKKNDELEASLICTPISEQWKNAFSHQWWAKANRDKLENDEKDYLPLFDKLLSFAGEEVCMPFMGRDLNEILTYGQFWFGLDSNKVRGDSGRCHSNSAGLYETNQDETLICTGYGLTEDGMWRQHSWLMRLKPNSNVIIETTDSRIAYFGVCFNYEKSKEFSDNNL